MQMSTIMGIFITQFEYLLRARDTVRKLLNAESWMTKT